LSGKITKIVGITAFVRIKETGTVQFVICSRTYKLLADVIMCVHMHAGRLENQIVARVEEVLLLRMLSQDSQFTTVTTAIDKVTGFENFFAQFLP